MPKIDLFPLVLSNDIEGMEAALKGGADVNQVDERGYTILMVAIEQKNTEVVVLLLNHHANVNYVTRGGDTALLSAAKFGYLEIVRLLLENGANVNYQNETRNTALLFAMRYGYLKIVNSLLAYGADVNNVNDLGCTPLIRALLNTDEKIVELLLKYAANPNIMSNRFLCTVFTIPNVRIKTLVKAALVIWNVQTEDFSTEVIPQELIENLKKSISLTLQWKSFFRLPLSADDRTLMTEELFKSNLLYKKFDRIIGCLNLYGGRSSLTTVLGIRIFEYLTLRDVNNLYVVSECERKKAQKKTETQPEEQFFQKEPASLSLNESSSEGRAPEVIAQSSSSFSSTKKIIYKHKELNIYAENVQPDHEDFFIQVEIDQQYYRDIIPIATTYQENSITFIRLFNIDLRLSNNQQETSTSNSSISAIENLEENSEPSSRKRKEITGPEPTFKLPKYNNDKDHEGDGSATSGSANNFYPSSSSNTIGTIANNNHNPKQQQQSNSTSDTGKKATNDLSLEMFSQPETFITAGVSLVTLDFVSSSSLSSSLPTTLGEGSLMNKALLAG